MSKVTINLEEIPELLALSRGTKSKTTNIQFNGSALSFTLHGDNTTINLSLDSGFKAVVQDPPQSIALTVDTDILFRALNTFKGRSTVDMTFPDSGPVVLSNGSRASQIQHYPMGPTVSLERNTLLTEDRETICSWLSGPASMSATSGIALLMSSGLLAVDSASKHSLCLSTVPGYPASGSIPNKIKDSLNKEYEVELGLSPRDLNIARNILKAWAPSVTSLKMIALTSGSSIPQIGFEVDLTCGSMDILHRTLDDHIYKSLVAVAAKVKQYKPEFCTELETGSLRECLKAGCSIEGQIADCIVTINNATKADQATLCTQHGLFTDTMPVLSANCIFNFSLRAPGLVKVLDAAIEVGITCVLLEFRSDLPAVYITVGDDVHMLACLSTIGIEYKVEGIPNEEPKEDEVVLSSPEQRKEAGAV